MSIIGLKKKLIFVEVFEDCGCHVIFSKAKSFLRHIARRKVKYIVFRVKNLYKSEVGDCVALKIKVEKVLSWDVGELWHSRLGHLHHGASKIMQKIIVCLPKGSLDQ